MFGHFTDFSWSHDPLAPPAMYTTVCGIPYNYIFDVYYHSPAPFAMHTETSCPMLVSSKDTLNKGHLCNKDTVCCPNYTQLCTNLPLN